MTDYEWLIMIALCEVILEVEKRTNLENRYNTFHLMNCKAIIQEAIDRFKDNMK